MKNLTPVFTKAMALALVLALPAPARAWWDAHWTARKKITLEGGDGAGAPVLVRLHEGNFQFGAAAEDGSDLRFLASDDKTELAHHVEKWDSLLGEAFVWVKAPEAKAGEPLSFWLYYGNTAGAARTDDAKGTYDADAVLVYHFAEHGTPAADATGLANNAEKAGSAADGSMIGTGLRLDGRNAFALPASASLELPEATAWTWSAWVKPASLAPNAVLYGRQDGDNSLVIGLDNGAPYAEVKKGGSVQRASGGAPWPVNTWKHLAVVADGAALTIYVDGASAGTANAALPSLKGPALLGAGFAGELDELQISKTARTAGFVKWAAGSQGAEAANLIHFETDESSEGGGHEGAAGKALEHVMLFGDIAKNMMFDGWMVVFFCALMAIVCWSVALNKFLYLLRIQKGSEEFLRQWKHVANDLTALDHSDAQSVRSLGGSADPRVQQLMHQSPLFHIYHIGSEEIRRRIENPLGFNGLSARSIQAIKASLHSGLTHEVHRMNRGLIFLTISIAGGPYVGLLGTVMGVMITFAVIAKSGEVEVNSIAPGIASALLATVAGLLVAIPALFIYSFLNSKIKDAISNMNMFIDEFISKMAEFYPPASENPAREYEQEETFR
jgi:biopolymer transport protein ExbB